MRPLDIKVDISATGQRIKSLMTAHSMNAHDIQDALGLGCVQSVYKWFSGHNLPTVDNLVMLAGLFDVKLDDIVVVEG